MVIVDVAHNWNESWVEKSNAAEREQVGAGQKWLYAILVSCAVLFGVSIGLFIYTIVQYHGCPLNDIVMAMTFLLICAVTAAQLSGEEGSLLGSACMAAWAVYLCHAAVAKNPSAKCHSNADEISIFAIVLGIAVTIVSILWTGWSYTAPDKLRNDTKQDDDDDDNNAAPSSANKPEQTTTVGGIVTGTTNRNDVEGGGDDDKSQQQQQEPRPSSENVTWRLNLALAVIACWASMILTHWGQVQESSADNNVVDPGVGRVSVWMIVASQWLALSLYLWTLLAPRLFPNRDFS
jgi:serine incorporator 1/3